MGIGGHGIEGTHMKAPLEAMIEVGKQTALELSAEQKDAAKAAQTEDAESVFRPRSSTELKKKSLKSRARTVTEMMKSKGEKSTLPIEVIRRKADEHSGKNPELKSKVLVILRERLKPGASEEEIQDLLDEFYPDPTLSDEALDFLLDTTEGELHQKVKNAKDHLNETKGREITAGRNIAAQARQAAEKGLGTPTGLRDMYRDVTGNPRDANTMFDELAEKYSYPDMQKVVKFLLHSLGADMKSKGPSIDKGELHRLFSETRSLQAILGVYRFFKGRMNLMGKLFTKSGLNLPQQLTFESMAKSFMTLAGERYPSSDKVLSQAKRLGIEDWILAKIIAFSQLRDAIREMSMNQIYRSLQHRDELLMAIIEALEDLEDELEELRERDEYEEGEDYDEEEGEDEEEEEEEEEENK